MREFYKLFGLIWCYKQIFFFLRCLTTMIETCRQTRVNGSIQDPELTHKTLNSYNR